VAFVRRSVCMHVGVALVSVLALTASAAPPDGVYFDKVDGAWIGKCVGGALGMPLEGWSYPDIDRKYPAITGYTGYFSDAWAGWSGLQTVAHIPTDGQWHALEVALPVPEFSETRTYVAPIIGMSLEYSTAPAAWEMRGLRIAEPVSGVAFDASAWPAAMGAAWPEPGTARFDFGGERSWIKMKPELARELALRPGQRLVMRFEARWVSGDDRIGFSLDYRSRELAKGFGPDDDTSYQIVGLHALESRGPDLSCRQIGEDWCELLPAITPALAEGLALERMRSGIAPPESGDHPIGQAIGGQMKGEIWGLVCPGRPDLAAEYARRDGVVAHHADGVYGEQFIAAMMSAAFTESDPRKLVEIGLAHIPAGSRYAETVRWVIELHDRYPDFRDTRREVIARYPTPCNPVYGDAGVVVLALLYGEGDFEKTISIAARCGSDTDCDTASVGALLGCIRGARALPRVWTDPIDDQFRCFVKGLETWSIAELAMRICSAGRQVLEFHGDAIRFTTPE
jgi:ADP-ribosylglycohydrolase